MEPMIISTSQGEVVIDINTVGTPPRDRIVKKVGIRISGGADSAILAYILALYKRDYHPDIELYPITLVSSLKPYQEIFAKNVIKKITELTNKLFLYKNT